MSIIFLAGVHGVGKGYLGSRVAKQLKIVHCTASELIRDEKGRETWSNEKIVADVDENQRALISAVTRIRDSGEPILLDGHFVLRGKDGSFVTIARDVFVELGLTEVIVLSDNPELIAKRISLRDGVTITGESVAALAIEEEKHAHDICTAIDIKLTVIKSPTELILLKKVACILDSANR